MLPPMDSIIQWPFDAFLTENIPKKIDQELLSCSRNDMAVLSALHSRHALCAGRGDSTRSCLYTIL